MEKKKDINPPPKNLLIIVRIISQTGAKKALS